MKKHLNIAMFGHKRIPSFEGGIEVVVEELSARLVKKGNKVTCYNRGGHHVNGKKYDRKQSKQYKNIRIKKVFTIDKKGLAAVTSSFFATIATSIGKYDVIHIHAEGPAFMCWLPKLFGKKVIVTIHGLDHQRAKWGKIASTFIMMGEKMAARFADGIIVLSEDVQNYFMKNYGRRTIFIPNGVNLSQRCNPEIIKDKWGLEKDSYILYLGRLVPEKGEKYLIEAFKKVNTDKKLVIAGGSSDTDEFMNQLKNLASGDENIIFTGFVQHKTKAELYSNAYIYCLPSDLEGMPLSLLEAMSYGNCCLVSDIPECATVVEDKGITFRKGDVDDLAEKIQTLCAQPELVRKYQNESADFVLSKYNWDDVVEKTLMVYKNDKL